ncbi:alpha/beta hydrolase [Microaerobacter geothermalis]|uniref:alpha/beta hydrolase n=1 Tax=Microaerobacter geothermalis TaxID=674972 RepID=UPI001F210664|nr:alpha/beta hydrolase [Microaerobacter geothermalis]MCF6093978.1 alpha/beta hydrolase [Microaerobacter geothermalis]
MKQYIKNKKGLMIHLIENIFGSKELFILCHGFTGSVESHVILKIRELLSELKLDNVSIDFTNNINDSGGDFSLHTISGEIEDLQTVYDKYQALYEKIYLVGHSMGCFVTTRFAIGRPLDGLILVAPPYSMKETIQRAAMAQNENLDEALAKWKEKGYTMIYKESLQKSFPLNYSFYEDLTQWEDMDLASYYQKLECPAFVVLSSDDLVVPPWQSKKLFYSLGSKEKILVEIAGATHSFDNGTDGKLTEAIREYLSAKI